MDSFVFMWLLSNQGYTRVVRYVAVHASFDLSRACLEIQKPTIFPLKDQHHPCEISW